MINLHQNMYYYPIALSYLGFYFQATDESEASREEVEKQLRATDRQ